MSRRLLLLALALCTLGAPAVAQADRDYSPRFGAVDRGDVTIASNTSMTCPSTAAGCAGAQAGTGPTIRNSAFTMTHVDVDNDPTTFNSSSADLVLPAGATVLFAGLYWGSDVAAGTGGVAAPNPAAKGTVLLSHGSTWSYSAVTATQVDTSRSFGGTRYQGFADVTQRVRASGAGTYTVANVQAATGADNFGGWGLVVAYRDGSRPVRWLGVYDGFIQFVDDTEATIPLSGFRTPSSGTVNADLGLMTYEGDLAVDNEVMRLNGRDVADALHPAGNYFNSRITAHGEYVQTKNPNYPHQLGHEASIVDVDGYLGNDATSAEVYVYVEHDYLQTGPLTLVSDEAPVAPASTVAPAVSGAASEGSTLTASTGGWSGSKPMTFTHQWQRCDAAGAACTDIAGATAATYAVIAADRGQTLRVRVTSTNLAGSATAASDPTAPVPSTGPVNSGAPSISGEARDGRTLTASPGTWSGSPTYAYQWRRCTPVCANVPGATAATYVLSAADVGATLRVRVVATSATGGSAVADSPHTATVVEQPPVNSALPSISGTAQAGEQLTASPGTWSGSPTFAYRWRRCEPTFCSDIVGATGPTYVLTAADVGHTIRLRVTATNSGGTARADSASTHMVGQAAPSNSVPPSISGTARDGQTLTASPGTWSGSPTYAYQWRRCETSCHDIAGATAASYLLTAEDVGKTIRVRVTATEGGSSATATSAATDTVAPKPPANSVAPSISGTARDGETLTASPGTWSGSPTYAYQWRRCSPTCVDAGTGSTYVLDAGDVGATIRVRVTGTNAGGSETAESQPTATVVERAPVNSVAPSISGTARDGETLTASPGTWSGSPAFTYQWRRCTATCVDAGTGSTYVLGAGDVGATIRVRVTGTNAGGSATAESQPTATVVERAPANSVAPSISGTARDGETLTASPGTWSGSPAFTYQWRRCTSTCVDAGAGDTYVLGAGDVGATMRVRVTGVNAGGSTTAESQPTATVVQKPPVNGTAPSVTGTEREGETLTASPGTWSGSPDLAYRWRRCDGATCADIDGATAETYVLTAADVGRTVRVRVTGTNTGGSAAADSAATAPVIAATRPPASSAPPTITGTAREGQTLTASPGTWSGGPTHAYRWRRCSATCVDVGTDHATYLLTASDVGATIRVRVTASNSAGSDTAESEPTATVLRQPPGNTAAPKVTGTAREGETLQADPGTWDRADTITLQWRRCDETCADVPGATGTTFALTSADVGRTIRLRVTAANDGGSTSAESAPTATVVKKETPAPPAEEPPVTQPPVTEEPVTPPPPAVEPPACDALTATYTRGRTGTLRLRLRLSGPATAVDFGIPAAMLPTRKGAKGAVGRLRLDGRAHTLRFSRTSRLGLTTGRSPSVRLTRGGARVARIGARVRQVDLTLVTPKPAPRRTGVTVEGRIRSAGGGLQRVTCALPARS